MSALDDARTLWRRTVYVKDAPPVIAVATIANAEALDRIAAALERIADTLDTRQTLDMLGDT